MDRSLMSAINLTGYIHLTSFNPMDSSLLLTSAVLALLLLFLSSSSGNVVDQEALLSLKASIEADPSGALSSWNESSNPCQWSGVLCNSQGRVTHLDLRGVGLTGSLTPSIGNLSHLQFLFLQENKFSGELPQQLGDLLHLKVLSATSNLIGGSLPPHISNCLSLTTLELSSNKFSGRIPAEFGLLSRLQILGLGKNLLTGQIPATIGNLSSLNTLDVGTNFLNGEIPSELGRLHNLNFLQISINNLTGHLPPSLYNLTSLTSFSFASNDLSGEIPGDIGHRLPNLRTLEFCLNKFTGLYPPSIHNLTKIQSLWIAYNLLDGPVPPGLGNLHDLTTYNIAGNRFVSSGAHGLDFLTSMTNCTKLEYLIINDNLLEGILPDSVGNLSKSITRIMLGGNRIFGSIPASIGQLANLSILNISYNSISGGIPPEIWQLKQLRVLRLAHNKLSGKFPVDIGDLAMLIELDLHGNQLEGSIPSSLGKLQNLYLLDMSGNKLEGNMPRELFNLPRLSIVLKLSSNYLTGSVPEDISNLENVIEIDLSDNLLSGNITNSIGKCQSLQTLSMANNSFSGPIPDSIGNLKGLQRLDLSLNQLSGPIPDSIGKLQALDYLNLSFNKLEGVVPAEGVFRNHSAVDLQGNSELCSSSSYKSTRKLRWTVLLSIIVASTALVFFILVSSTWIFLIKRRRNTKKRLLVATTRGQYPIISYEELHRATERFAAANLLGSGSFGCVYKGVLRDGLKVAVKVLNLEDVGALKSFVAECEALRNVRHRNLVKLITLCLSLDSKNNEFHALVYEFMGKGSLDDWIRGKRRHEDGRGLSLVERLDAAIDIASALDYLHNDCEFQVVHCDLKPSNVVLDEDMTAKVGDFGLAKVLVNKDEAEYSAATRGLKGSIGYIPPEYGFGGKASPRGDAYSYGVMLLEFLTGRSPTNEEFAGDVSLKTWVRDALPGELMRVLDSELTTAAAISYGGRKISREKQEECLASMVRVGLSCAEESPDARLTMRVALARLKSIRDELIKPVNYM